MSAQAYAERPPDRDGERRRTPFAAALGRIAALAGGLDREPRFPAQSFDELRAAGVVQGAADRETSGLVGEAAIVRAVAAADASVARILDGHFNGVERLALLAPPELRADELAAIARGELLLGVWGADPAPGEGQPAQVRRDERGALSLHGVKTFCSGAGGVQRALVVARDEDGRRRIAYVDTASGMRIDRSWYRASGLRASESHRVELDGARVLALLGADDEIMREPWFSRDAVRTSATWVGLAERIVAATVAAVGERQLDDLALHALGRMRVARTSLGLWLDRAVARLDHAPTVAEQTASSDARWRTLSAETRLALADATRAIAAGSVRVCGSRELVAGGALDRARRDLDLFVLQHRLEPKLVELGTQTLADGSS